MYESTIELTTSRGDKIYVFSGREPVTFEYADSSTQHIYCEDSAYAYTHGGEGYRAACDALAEYLAVA